MWRTERRFSGECKGQGGMKKDTVLVWLGCRSWGRGDRLPNGAGDRSLQKVPNARFRFGGREAGRVYSQGRTCQLEVPLARAWGMGWKQASFILACPFPQAARPPRAWGHPVC